MRRTSVGICCYNEFSEIFFHKLFLQFFLPHCACKSDNLNKLLIGENIFRQNWLNVSHNKSIQMQVIYITRTRVGRNSSVSIATLYGLDDPGIEFQWRRDSPHSSSPALGPTQPPTKWVPYLFPWGKTTWAWRWPRTPYSAEVKERVKLYLYSWPVLGCTSTFTFTKTNNLFLWVYQVKPVDKSWFDVMDWHTRT
jgi:hypothetical protein